MRKGVNMSVTQKKINIDPVATNLWHPICATDDVLENIIQQTVLLEQVISFSKDSSGTPYAWVSEEDITAGQKLSVNGLHHLLPSQIRYGHIWTCLGVPSEELFTIPEYDEVDRRNLSAGTIGVNVSAPRAIENFLDMGHFPYVHTDILGVEPHTEVKEYDVEVSVDQSEIIATGCRFYQPMASTASSGGADVDYKYRVPHPYCSVLYKSSPLDESRQDIVAVFIQPIDEEHIRAHMLLCILDDQHDDTFLREFQQTIFGQDKPILENQCPKRLPLDPRSETPIRADKTAIAYRRWLRQKGIRYGVIPEVA